MHLLACDELRGHEFGIELGGEPYVTIAGQRVDVRAVSTIWWRRPSVCQRLSVDAFDDNQTDFVNTNSSILLRSFLGAAFAGEWVSSPEATDRANDKLHQLRAAQNLGFRVPDTLVSNDPDAVRAFHREHDGNVIVKPARNSRGMFLTVQRLDLAGLSDDQIHAVPSIYQELIPGTRHLRVNCFGARVHAALIETDDLDWRSNLNGG